MKESIQMQEEIKELYKPVKFPTIELLYDKIMAEQIEFALAAEIVLMVREVMGMREKLKVGVGVR